MTTSSTFVSDPPSFQETSPVPRRQRGDAAQAMEDYDSVSDDGQGLRLPPRTELSDLPTSDKPEMGDSPAFNDLEDAPRVPSSPPAAVEDRAAQGQLLERPAGSRGDGHGRANDGTTSGPSVADGDAPVLSQGPSPAPSPNRDRVAVEPRSSSAPPVPTGVTVRSSTSRHRDEVAPETMGRNSEGTTPASSTAGEHESNDNDDGNDEDEYDTIAGIAAAYSVSVEEMVKWNPYLAVYGVEDPLPPDLPIVLPMAAGASTERAETAEAEAKTSTPEASVEPWIEVTPSPAASRPAR